MNVALIYVLLIRIFAIEVQLLLCYRV